jgi:hypothetical protein
VNEISNLGEKLMKVLSGAAIVIAGGILLSGCMSSYGPARPGQAPNAIQRSTVLSSNEKSITIEHSTWGKPIAFETAEKHCGSMGFVAVYRGGTRQYGPDVVSTWTCE